VEEHVGGIVIGTEAIERRLADHGLEGRWEGGTPPEALAEIADDSRRVGRGYLFCAIPGTRVDGRSYLGAARRAGAAAAVVERYEPSCALPQLVVPDARAATSHLAALFHADPGQSLDAVGVTGTNGKTTTVWLLRHVLAAHGPAASIGTLGVIGPDAAREPGKLTTPGPVELMERLARFRDGGIRSVALEISSHALDQHRTDGLPLAAAVFTNFTREHLDYHPDMESYRRAKLRLATLVRPGGACVVNADEPAWAELDPGQARRVTFGLSADADVRAEDVTHGRGGSRWSLVYGGTTAEVRLPLPGAFNVHNALGAAAAALALDFEVEEVAARLSSAPQVPGRMEVLHRGPTLVLRDYAHTPDAFERVLTTLRPAGGRLLLVFGCGGDRDPGKRPLMGRVAAERADLVFLTTDNPRSEDPADIVREIEAGMKGQQHRVVLDRRDAIAAALEEAGPGDVVLLAGKGHEDYQLMGEHKEPFDEARIVAELTGDEQSPSGIDAAGAALADPSAPGAGG
jgi:UDP-N-acetylmuramoyl-L-alanyl-D-glutamate--2,6-diaminopimelate ligase